MILYDKNSLSLKFDFGDIDGRIIVSLTRWTLFLSILYVYQMLLIVDRDS